MDKTAILSEHLSGLSQKQRAALLERVRAKLAENQLEDYRPYIKQAEFHAGTTRERLFMAGNQLGKSVAGAHECAIHLTGRYPDWWQGKRFDKPPVGWAAGETGEVVRDTIQRLLLGRSRRGTGAIPKDALLDVSSAMGTPGLVGIIKVRHASGGESSLTLKSYNQGREKFQGETLDFVWFDEEPDLDIYTEGLTRTNTTGGPVWMTFTPLKGMSDVVSRFLMEPSPSRSVTQMTIEDAEHYTPERRAEIIASYPPHEREARTKGVPIMGSGRVFPVPEADICVKPMPIAPHWARIVGLDLGWDHPTSAAWLAWDRDADIVYVTDVYRKSEATPVIHAAAIKPKGDWIPVAWPSDAGSHGKDGATPMVEQYRGQGLNMLTERAQFDDGSVSVEAGLMEMLDRMQTGRLKVFEHLVHWWEEFRLYHRKDGKIVKERDDLMDATRYGLMMLRHATTRPEKRKPIKVNTSWVE